MQKATPKIAKIPIKADKEKDSKTPPSRVDQQPLRGIVIPLESLIPFICHATKYQTAPKASKC